MDPKITKGLSFQITSKDIAGAVEHAIRLLEETG
jgi:hypothetical protein